MGKSNTTRRETAWLTVRELANALDVTEGFVRREVLRRVPDDLVRRDARPMTVYGRGAIKAWLGERPKPAIDNSEPLVDDTLLAIDLELLALGLD